MIRVNLLKNRSEATRGGSTEEVKFETAFQTELTGDQTNPALAILFKLILMGIGVGGLMGYESHNVGRLQGELNQVNAKKNTITKQLADKKPVADSAKVLQKKINDIEARIKAIKDLSRFRLREIKALDYIQNNIPERVWVNSLDFQETQMVMEGGSVSDDELNKFIESLEGRSAFKNVILVRSKEEKKKEGTVKFFQIKSELVSTE